jgi:hypothetical protein
LPRCCCARLTSALSPPARPPARRSLGSSLGVFGGCLLAIKLALFIVEA